MAKKLQCMRYIQNSMVCPVFTTPLLQQRIMFGSHFNSLNLLNEDFVCESSEPPVVTFETIATKLVY